MTSCLLRFIYVLLCFYADRGGSQHALNSTFLQLNHEGKCEFMIIPCPSCKEHIRFNEQERHNERECPERTLNCKYCKEPFHFKNIKVRHDLFRPARMLSGLEPPITAAACVSLKETFVFQAHDEICPKYPMICEGCAKKKIPREKVHL